MIEAPRFHWGPGRHATVAVRLCLVVVLLPLATGPVRAQDPESEHPGGEDWLFSRDLQTREIGSKRRLELVNEHGDIRARDSADDRIEVVANIQRHVSDERALEVRIEETDSAFEISAAFAKTGSEVTSESSDGSADRALRGRLDLTVLIPAGVDVNARTSDGLLELKGIQGSVEGSTEGGDIVLSTARAARLETGNGDIQALFKSTDWARATELRTVNGEIAVWLPPDASVSAVLSTSGLITTDYSIEIERDDTDSRKSARARIGEGRAELLLESERGPIKILRSH